MVPDSKALLRKTLGTFLLVTTIGLATWQSVGHALFSSAERSETAAADLV